MPVRISQPADFPGGRALVRIDGAPAIEPRDLTIAIRRGEGPEERYLDPRVPKSPWSPAKFDFPPINPTLSAGGLQFELDHAVTYHMTANMTFVLRVLDAATGQGHEERAVWTGVRRLRSELPEGWTPPPPPIETSPDPVPTPPPVSDPPELTIAPEDRIQPSTAQPQPKPEAKGKSPLIWVALVLLLVAGGAAGWWLTREKAPPEQIPPAAEAPKPPSAPAMTLDEARKYLAGSPDPTESLKQAEAFRAAKSLDGAFLLYRHAAQAGSIPAAIAVGAMYDPATWSAEASPLPAPNATEAANWFRMGAEKGDAEAEFRLGRVLMSGKTDEPDGPEKGVVWLRKAAEQGHATAQAALPK